ncbi:S8 family serine peptidase [Actinomadura sp. NEAU-AAG7]|uniref:S8 family serine peptidase n=1 Tax=Actinomadura sp. NEAU-AAG7 TaxID=2839640 RepID=UPI001BE3CFEF|nr:S8 family serine peptidase [Actinomadura sp. NEAU-AAG7]MBT2212982.1 S8 family serine peptidase [Actinomadura sp. NEAU-AAG7]
MHTRTIRSAIALTGVIALVSTHAAPVRAASSVARSEEWWFDAWEIEEKVWPVTRGKGVVVAVVDTGVEARLPDLDGVVLKGTTYNGPGGGDGRKDGDSELGGHGTAMAALIAGQGRGTGMMGIAPESRILPITAGGLAYARSIRYAVDHGAQVINISAVSDGSSCPDDLQQAVEYAAQHDVVIVAGAGNDGFVAESGFYPANCAGVLTAGAVDAYLKIWTKSTPGDNVMIAAPGVTVGSISKRGTFDWDRNGTSQATALTSGVVALMRARYPRMPGRQIVQRILATAKDVGPKGWDKRSGYGAIIPYLALTANVASDAPNPVYSRLPPAQMKEGTNPSPSKQSIRTTATDYRKSGGGGLPWWSLMVMVLGVALIIAGAILVRRRRFRGGGEL